MNAITIANTSMLQLLLEGVLKQPIHLLWINQKIEEELVKRLLQCGFDQLRLKTKDENYKEKVFELLSLTIGTYGSQFEFAVTQFNSMITELLYNQENIAEQMAEFIAVVVENQGPQIATDVVHELTTHIGQTNSQFETMGIKNIGKFLSRLSKLSPKAIYLNIGRLLGFFDCEAYLLRQSLIKMLSNTIIRVFNPKLDPDLPLETRNVYN